jgi:hypothetical protein
MDKDRNTTPALATGNEFVSTGTGVVTVVFLILGGSFLFAGLLVLFLVQFIWVGLPFVLAGVAFFIAGRVLWLRRAGELQRLLTTGHRVTATIDVLRRNRLVRVNNQHPWIVHYRYEIAGHAYHSQESVIALPPGYEIGANVPIAYDRNNPKDSTLFRK